MISLLFILFPLVEPTPQMIIVWGEVESANGVTKHLESWQECNLDCISDASCVLISETADGGCDLFHLGDIVSVRKLTSDSGKVVGFKRTLDSNQCVVAEDPPLFGQAEVTEASNYIISRTTLSDGSVIWMFNLKCATTSWKSIRGQNVVCLEVRIFPNPYCGTFAEASSLCSSNNGMGMSGPYDANEESTIRSKAVALYKAVTEVSYEFNGILVDGVWKEAPRVYTITDNTLDGTSGYRWNADYNSNEKCVFITSPDSNKLRTTVCEETSYRPYPKKSCHRAVICRTIPYS